MNALEEIGEQIREQLKTENRVTACIRAASFREVMGSQSDWQLEQDVSFFAGQDGQLVADQK